MKKSKGLQHNKPLRLISRIKFRNSKTLIFVLVFAVVGTLIILVSRAAGPFASLDVGSNSTVTGAATKVTDSSAYGGSAVRFKPSAILPPNYTANLQKLQSSPYRNKNNDSSPFLNVASAALPLNQLYGTRQDLANRGEGRNLTPDNNIGIFRARCEFSHFSYDDPIVFPNQPAAAHLHMMFGNTQANAYSTYDNLINSGGSTCNGKELNRSSYWVPAMIDGNLNVRIPSVVYIYYKSYGNAIGKTNYFPDNMKLVSNNSINKTEAPGYMFICGDMLDSTKGTHSDTIPTCHSTDFGGGTRLEMNVKFDNCWNGQDPSNYNANFTKSQYSWFGGPCPTDHSLHFSNIEFRVFYELKPGEDTSSWILSSDVDHMSGNLTGAHGVSSHGDWFGGWNKDVNKMWVDRCNNVHAAECGSGYLGGNEVSDPYPALVFRGEYTGSITAPGADLFRYICGSGKTISRPEDIAFCK